MDKKNFWTRRSFDGQEEFLMDKKNFNGQEEFLMDKKNF